MDRVRTYQITVWDGLDERVCNLTSPLQITVMSSDLEATLLEVSADQSGLIGLLRHLHQQGYLLLSIVRAP